VILYGNFNMETFSDVVDATDRLSLDEQTALLELLRHRVAGRNRERLVQEVAEARSEYRNGSMKAATPQSIMDEVLRES